MIYLDYHATTPCDPRVVEAMLPYFSEEFGNPSSSLHVFGRRAARAVEDAREHVANLIGASSTEIVFTGGATESNNSVIFGLAQRRGAQRRRIVTTPIEHKAVLEPCRRLAEAGFDIVELPVDRAGTVDSAAANEVIDEETLLVSVQFANNEIGTVQPLAEIASIARAHGAFFHTDAAQAVGKLPIDVDQLGIDFLSISGHKLYGPKGIGALYVRSGLRRVLEPRMLGGGQEAGLRPGTLNAPGIVGLGEACQLAALEMEVEAVRVGKLRDKLERELTASVPGIGINGNRHSRLPGNSSLTFPGVEADALVQNLPQLALSTGSACTSGALEPSHVLTAIGLDREEANATVRVGIGRFTVKEEIELAASQIGDAWRRLAALD